MVEPARYSKELIMLTEVSIIFGPAAAHVIVSAVTIALGAFIAASPRQAARMWRSERLANLAPAHKASNVFILPSKVPRQCQSVLSRGIPKVSRSR
jgi:hypothetical protein